MTLDCTCNRLREAERKAEKLAAALADACAECAEAIGDCPNSYSGVQPRECDAECGPDVNVGECWTLYFLGKRREDA